MEHKQDKVGHKAGNVSGDNKIFLKKDMYSEKNPTTRSFELSIDEIRAKFSKDNRDDAVNSLVSKIKEIASEKFGNDVEKSVSVGDAGTEYLYSNKKIAASISIVFPLKNDEIVKIKTFDVSERFFNELKYELKP